MISVGIDVSKGKSMVCILKPNEDYVCKNIMLKVDQIDHAVIYSRIIRFCEDDKNNLNL